MDEFQIPNFMQFTDQDVFSSLVAPKPDYSPQVSLRVKIAAARKQRQDRKREIDKATMPFIQADIVESEKRQIDIQKSIDQALAALKAPPPTQTRDFNEAELYAGAIGGLLSGGNLPEVLNALARVSGARNDMEFEDKLRQYGLNREQIQVSLKFLQDQMQKEYQESRDLKNQRFDLNRDQMRSDDDWERMFTEAEIEAGEKDLAYSRELGFAQLKRGWDVEDQERELAAKAPKEQLDLKLRMEREGVDDFGGRIARQFPAGHAISADQAEYVNGEADDFVDNYYERDTPEWFRMRERIGNVLARDVSPSLAWQKEKYEKEAPDRALQGRIDEATLQQKQLDIAKERNKPTPQQVEKRRKLAAIDKRINEARTRRRELEAIGPDSDSDEDVAKFQQELRRVRLREFTAVSEKQKLLGKAPGKTVGTVTPGGNRVLNVRPG